MKRTLGVTIVIVAAIAASLTLARQRQPERVTGTEPDPGVAPALDADLDAIRSAGL